jgi:type I restriction enzyme S subunit
MPVLVPPQALRQRFSLTTSRHLDRLLNNTRSIAKLSALRDTLLPRLLSGEVTVPVAVTLTEEAGQ